MGPRLSLSSVAFVLVLLGSTVSALAVPITYEFSVTAIDGPVQGFEGVGQFAYKSPTELVDIFFGDVSMSGPVVDVPIPDTMWLIAAGMLAVWCARRQHAVGARRAHLAA
jgi:hypothetical protein